VEEIARVYADALFEVAKEKDALDEIHDQLDEFADSLNESRDMRTFFFSPYFSSADKREAIRGAISGANEELMNFLELLAEKHRMPAIFRIRDRFDELWAEARKRLEVRLTSAVELDKKVADQVRKEVERQTDREVDLETEVDPDILGGLVLRVGNRVVDASLRGKLEKLRKEVARAT
jgi:F-type H+-transporting ATPase subunit delta